MNSTLTFAALGLRPLRSSFLLLAVLLLLLPALAVRAQDNAAFVSQNVPTAMVAGQPYSVSVTMQNTGSTTWTDGNGYSLGSSNPQDNYRWYGATRIHRSVNVPPGGRVSYAFLAYTPATAGSYNFQWQMVHAGVRFGANSNNLAITVTVPAGYGGRPQIPRGGSSGLNATGLTGAGGQTGSWLLSGNGVSASNSSPQGYSVSCTLSRIFTVSVPASAPVTANVGVNYSLFPDGAGCNASFDIVAARPIPPAPTSTGAPYSWQASVGGVNTANGNKFVSVPLVGWIGRGGMPVGLSLAWNSQAPNNNNPTNAQISGPKWTFNYEVFLIQSGNNVTITWGDGRTYTFSRNTDGSYNPPKGIYDTLTPNTSNGSFDLKTKGQTTYHFGFWGAAHYLTSIVDENGNTTTLNRQAGARIMTVTDPSGRTITLAYDSSSRLNYVRDDQTGRYWAIFYDGSGNLNQINWPGINGTVPHISFHYDANPNLIEFDDLNGHAAWTAYYLSQPYCALATEWDAANNSTTFDYTNGTKVTDANGYATTYAYQGGVLQSVTDPLNHTDSYAYDGANNITQHIDRRGKIWSYNVSVPNGDAIGNTDPLGQGGTTVYDARNGKPLQETDANGSGANYEIHSTYLIYDANGINLLSTTDALGHSSTINSYQWGLPTSVSDALGHTNTLSYDGDGNVVQATDANGNSSTATYNRAGWKLTSTDGLGQTTGSRYDAWGRVTSVNTLPSAGLPLYKLVSGDGTHSFETANQSEYNSAQQSGWVPQPPVGGVFQYSTDKPGLVPLYRMRENPSGDRFYTTSMSTYTTAVQQWGYADEGIAGYVMSSPAAGFKPLYYAYLPGSRDYFTDDANEYNNLPSPWVKNGILCYVFNNTVSTTYDNNGNALTVTDQNGHTVTNTYDNNNRLVTTTKANGDQVTCYYDYPADPNDHSTANNRRGRLACKADGNGNILAYGYSARGELKALYYYPDNSSEYFTYDENGDLYQHTKRDGSIITNVYDNDSQLINTNYPAGGAPNVTLGYDPDGRQTTMADGTGTTNWYYDAANNLTQLSAPGGTVGYGYDNANRRISMTQGGHTTLYYYDNGGRMQTLDNGLGNVFDFTYDNANRLKTRINRQAVGTAYTYNSAGLITNILSNQNQGSGGTLNTDTYTYDPAGNRITSNSYDGYTAYSYDAANQITTENHNTGYPSFIATYTYDHNGNRLTKTVGSQTDTYTYQANRSNSQIHTDELLSVQGGILGSKAFTYDANGVARTITTNGQTLYLTADTEDRYTRFDFNTGPGHGSVYAYETYNGLGLRTFRHDSGGHDFPAAYDGASPGAPLLSSAQTLFTPGLMQQDNGVQHFYQTDALGNVRGVTNNSQSPLNEVYYDAFGLSVVRQGSTPSPLGFVGASGYQTDTDTGLMLLGHRYYDPTIGRFLSPDSVHDGNNWYAYCSNDPLIKTDPNGLEANFTDPNGFTIGGTDPFLTLNNPSNGDGYGDNNAPPADVAQYYGGGGPQDAQFQLAAENWFPDATASVGLGGADQLFVFGFGVDLGLGLRTDGTLMINGDAYGNSGATDSWGYGGTVGPEATIGNNNLNLNQYGFAYTSGPMSNTNDFGGFGPYGGSMSRDGSSTTASVGNTIGLAHQKNTGRAFSIGINPLAALYNSVNNWGQKNIMQPFYQMYGHSEYSQ